MSTQPNVLPFPPRKGCKQGDAAPLQRQAAAALKARAAVERSSEARRKVKIDRAAGVLDRLEARAEAFSLEIKALQARKALVSKRANRIEESVLALMRRHALDKLEGIHRTLIARPAPVSLLVTDESLIPAEYLRIKTEPMKVEIKTALGRGERSTACGLFRT